MQRSHLLVPALLLVTLAPSAYLAWRFRAMPHLRATGDDQLYLVSGKSLAENRGYRILSLPGEPFQTKYPVLYPLWLSLLWRLAPGFPGNLPLFMLASYVFLPIYVIALRRTFLSLRFEPAESWLLCALAVMNPAVLAAATSVGPDLACSFLILVVLLLLDDSGRRGPERVVLAGVLSGAACLLRSAVFPALLTAPLYLLWRRGRARALLFVSAMAPFVVGWGLWARAHQPTAGDATTLFYTNYLGDFLLHFSWSRAPGLALNNLRSVLEYAGMSAAFVAAIAAPALLGGLSIVGAAWLARRRGVTPYHVFAAAYLAMLVIWPYKPLLRYLLPVLPLISAGLGSLVLRLVRSTAPRHARPMGLAALSALCCASAALGFSTYHADLQRFESGLAAERAAYAWIRDHLPSSARFVAAHDGVLYLYTGRQATMYEPLKEFYLEPRQIGTWRQNLPQFARSRGAGYAFCDARLCAGALSEQETPLARAVLREHYREIFRIGEVTVYELAE
ncbi:MAG: hypothetical protein ACE141_04845 [Bryobacteraceae bacterium]